MAMRMAVAAKPKEMALAFMDEEEAAPSSRASPATGSDGVAAAPIQDRCPTKPLMAGWPPSRSIARAVLPNIGSSAMLLRGKKRRQQMRVSSSLSAAERGHVHVTLLKTYHGLHVNK
jgi:hypothetical protein